MPLSAVWLRRGAVLAATLALLAAAPAAAAPKTETASSGTVQATFSYTDAGDGKHTGLRLVVTRDGQPAFDAAPTTDECGEPYCAPFGTVHDKSSLRVTDVDGDGEPEVVVDLYTGGAHCCVVAQILRWSGSGYLTASRNFADFGYTLDAPAAAGAPATFVTGDPRFAYAFASFAESAFPVRLLTFVGGVWKDVTRAHPESLQADAQRWMKQYRERRAGPRSLGVLAAWVADEYRLGRRATADRFLAAELRAGRLRGDKLWPQRKAYVKVLQRRLKAWGYLAG